MKIEYLTKYIELPKEVTELYANSYLKALGFNGRDFFTKIAENLPKTGASIINDNPIIEIAKQSFTSISLNSFGETQYTYYWSIKVGNNQLLAHIHIGGDKLPDYSLDRIDKMPDYIKCFYEYTDGISFSDEYGGLGSGLGLPNSLGDFRNINDYLIENEIDSKIENILTNKYPEHDFRVFVKGLNNSFLLYDRNYQYNDIVFVDHSKPSAEIRIIDSADKFDEYLLRQYIEWKNR